MNFRVKKPFNSTQRRFAVGDTITDADKAELAPHTVESAKAAGLIEPAKDQAANLPVDGKLPAAAGAE